MKAAVLGSPIEHSLSPALHNAGYLAAGLADWSYGRFRVEEDELAGFLEGLDADWRGFSCTMPLKRAVLEVAAEVSPLAARAGAGNTLVRRADGGWDAHNTDVGGLVDALRPAWDPSWRTAAVLGSGSTARSALLALEELGVTSATVYARNPDRVAALADWAADAGVAVVVAPGALAGWGAGSEPAVLSTLPPAPGVEASLDRPRGGLLFDAVYAGWPTPLARAAAASGMAVVSGFDLLVHQAGRQFELFTGVAAPLEAMRAAGLRPTNPEPVEGGFDKLSHRATNPEPVEGAVPEPVEGSRPGGDA